ncbi:hypothetical protein [uncultured Rhodoblastus sp.]|uniref:hypothetical protein n=1 Tax=uncultured Rhodoblastus sp. TaxID=543037 RepID=UPI0025EF38EE|nr:hypothetical protein [uncultured Rhodoblastus sp.]
MRRSVDSKKPVGAKRHNTQGTEGGWRIELTRELKRLNLEWRLSRDIFSPAFSKKRKKTYAAFAVPIHFSKLKPAKNDIFRETNGTRNMLLLNTALATLPWKVVSNNYDITCIFEIVDALYEQTSDEDSVKGETLKLFPQLNPALAAIINILNKHMPKSESIARTRPLTMAREKRRSQSVSSQYTHPRR